MIAIMLIVVLFSLTNANDRQGFKNYLKLIGERETNRRALMITMDDSPQTCTDAKSPKS
jgi:hypothetical protein